MSVRKEQKEGSSITYYINEEKGTVEAKMPVEQLVRDIVNDCYKYRLSSTISIEEVRKYPHKNFIGIAKCNPNDEFNVEVGKRIAAARMLQKYYKTRLNAYRAFADVIDEALSTCEDLMNYSWLAFDRNVKKEVSNAFPSKSE